MRSVCAIAHSGAGRALLLLVVAAFLLSPSLVLGTMNSHSAPGNLHWAAQFADQFRSGILYPRVTPDEYDGLGGASFYFYPPVVFWLDAVLSVVTFDAFSVSWRLSLAALLLLWASGLAMDAWLRSAEGSGEGASPLIALVGALAYMAAPYHLLDHYWRGAFAEFGAFVVLPLLMLGVRRVALPDAAGRRFGVVLLALAYAALPMTHLPTSLLISVTALPMYVLYCAWRQDSRAQALRFLARAAAGGALGLGLAAIYAGGRGAVRPTAWPLPIKIAAGLLGLTAIAALPALDIMVTGIQLRIQDTLDRYDPPVGARQFQPAGYPQPGGGYSDLNLGPVANLPTIACTPAARLCRAESAPFGTLRIEIDADAPTEVVVRRFYWPFWRLTPALSAPAPALEPTETLRLVSFVAPAGHHVWQLERAAVAEQKAGWMVSGLSLVVLLGLVVWDLRSRRWPKDAAPSRPPVLRPPSSAALAD